MRKCVTLFSIACLAAVAGCTTKETTAPPLTGPSEFALRLALQSVPDSILQDGASQSAISIEATGADNRPVRGLPLRVEMSVNNSIQDFGTLSARTIVTGEDGRARVVYTAPPRPVESVGEGTVVTFIVTPIGGDYRGEQPRTVDLRLVPPGVILAPNSAPVPNFASSCTLQPFNDIVFDASSTTDERDAAGNPLPCGANCTYAWDMGDGTTKTGIFVRHQYRSANTYQVKLTATDARGASATIARAVQIGAATPPTAVFTFSPTPTEVGQVIFFNGSRSTAAAGRRIVSYDWDFGSGRTGSGMTVSKSYDNPGTYTVTLTVTDDAGTTGTASQTVQVGNVTTNPGGSLTASLVVTPTTSATAAAPLSTTFLFDASASTGPARIVEYRFNMGDGSPDAVQTSAPTWQHQFRAAGIYNVRVTVRDAQGRTATATRTVYVQ
jgi:PKD repeat protein